MSERSDATGNEQGSPGGSPGGTNQNGQSGGGGSTAQGANQGNTQNGNGQGSTDSDISKHPSFTALATKLEKVIQDNTKYRERLRSLVTDDEGDGGSGATTGTKSETAEILAELRSERALNRLSAAATKAGFITPELILNFVDLDEISDKKGHVKDPDKAVADLKVKYPRLFGDAPQGSGDGAAGSRNRSGNESGDMNALLRRRLRG